METIKQASKQIIEQLIRLAECISDENFTEPLSVLLNNSIGKHYRHIIEFYQVMFEGLNSGLINYDNREHDPELEQNRNKCLEALRSIEQRSMKPIMQKTMELSVSYSVESDDLFSVATHVEREMVYNIEHAIHHMAIIRIAIQHEFPDIRLEEEFGFAYSTLKHLRQQ